MRQSLLSNIRNLLQLKSICFFSLYSKAPISGTGIICFSKSPFLCLLHWPDHLRALRVAVIPSYYCLLSRPVWKCCVRVCMFVLFLLVVVCLFGFFFFFLFFSRLRCAQMQQRSQKQEDCGMQICQCAIQLGYCYKWNTSSRVRRRKYQVLKGQPYSFWYSLPDRFFSLQKVYLFFLSYRLVNLEGTSWVSKLYLFLLLISSMNWKGFMGEEVPCLCLFVPITLSRSCSDPSPVFFSTSLCLFNFMPFFMPIMSFSLNCSIFSLFTPAMCLYKSVLSSQSSLCSVGQTKTYILFPWYGFTICWCIPVLQLCCLSSCLLNIHS